MRSESVRWEMKNWAAFESARKGLKTSPQESPPSEPVVFCRSPVRQPCKEQGSWTGKLRQSTMKRRTLPPWCVARAPPQALPVAHWLSFATGVAQACHCVEEHAAYSRSCFEILSTENRSSCTEIFLQVSLRTSMRRFCRERVEDESEEREKRQQRHEGLFGRLNPRSGKLVVS